MMPAASVSHPSQVAAPPAQPASGFGPPPQQFSYPPPGYQFGYPYGPYGPYGQAWVPALGPIGPQPPVPPQQPPAPPQNPEEIRRYQQTEIQAAPLVVAAAVNNDPIKVGSDFPCLPKALYDLILTGQYVNPRLLTKNEVRKLDVGISKEQLRSHIAALSKDPLSELAWTEAYAVLMSVFASSEFADEVMPSFTAYNLHMQLKRAVLPDWGSYDQDFRTTYPLRGPDRAKWSEASSTVEFLSALSAPRVTLDTGKEKSKAPKSAAQIKKEPCYNWNAGKCDMEDDKCPRAHVCRNRGCGGKHTRAECTQPKNDGTATKKKRLNNECESFFPVLPSPREVCSFNINMLSKYLEFMLATRCVGK